MWKIGYTKVVSVEKHSKIEAIWRKTAVSFFKFILI
jgi:hypothetical protein